MLGEAYADIRIIDDLNLYVGRKEYDTPFINRNDVRMTPNTFEAIVLQGKVSFGANEVKASPGTNDGKASLDANEGKPSSSANGATLKSASQRHRRRVHGVWRAADGGRADAR